MIIEFSMSFQTSSATPKFLQTVDEVADMIDRVLL